MKDSLPNSYKIRHKTPSPLRSSLSLAKRFLEGVIVPDERVTFFHGKITRETAERILISKGTIDGSYLLRESINWNYAVSICFQGSVHHYNIERQNDGSYRIPTGHLFPGPIELIQYHSTNLDGFLTLAQIPVDREPGEYPIIITGINSGELEDHIKLKAFEMGLTGPNIGEALNGPMREHLQYLVLKDIHLFQSWFHNMVGRREAEKRLARAGLYDGDFLVRLRKEDVTYVLSIVYHNEPKHYRIEKEFEHFSIEGGQKFMTLVELIDHYHFRQDGLLYKLKRGIHNPDYNRTRSGSNSVSHERSLSPNKQHLTIAQQMVKNIIDIKCQKSPISNANFEKRNSTHSLPSLSGAYPINSQNTSPTSSSTSSQGGGQRMNYNLQSLEKQKIPESYPVKSPDQVSDLINLSDWPNLSKQTKNPKFLHFLPENSTINHPVSSSKDGLQHTPFTPPTPMPNVNDFTTPTPQNTSINPLDLISLPPPPKNLNISHNATMNLHNTIGNNNSSIPTASLQYNPRQCKTISQMHCIRPNIVQSNMGPHTADLTATVDALVQMTFSGKKNLSTILPTDNSLHSVHILDTNWEEPESSESNFSVSSFLNSSNIANNPTNPFNMGQESSSNLSSVSSFLPSSNQVSTTSSANTTRQVSVISNFDEQGIYDKIPITTFQLNRDQLTLKERLGGGNFGHVVRGIYQPSFGGEIPVAVKTLKESSMVLAEEKEILAEAKTMSQLRHRNIVRLIGICKDHHFMLVLELARLGPINKYLRKHLDFSVQQIAELMSQVAQGMAYLESCKFVHRDLAARNVLLVRKDFAKISDFGMSKALNMGSDYYQSKNAGKWPLKWYAPECIYYYRFDSKSDVWSYGITLWECFSYGEKPYKDMKGTEILAMLDEGGRLKKPQNCPDSFYEIMLNCWQFDGGDRPSFSEIVPHVQRHCKNLR